ncbi:hypothetical protein K501DRAFT_337746 [Backusella circina FSU 941]|nr:hypothetical protein K501DRAFT_337746 [Backusella circina FSU 941]
MAIIRVVLHRNSSNEYKFLTFGLWRYCLWDSDSGSGICSPVNMKFDPDFKNIFQSLTRNQFVNISSSHNSYVRFVPLFMASVLSIAAFVISLFILKFNEKKIIQRCALLITIGSISIISSVICSISYGMTFHSYSSNIKRLCASGLTSNDEVTSILSCSSYTIKDESILLFVTIGIQVITFIYSIFCLYQTRHLATRQKNEIVSQPPLFLDSTVHSEKTDTLYKRDKEVTSTKSLSDTKFWSEHPTENTYNTQLSLRPRPVSNQMNAHYPGRRSKEITCHGQPLHSAPNQIFLNPATIMANDPDNIRNGSLDMCTSGSSLSLGDSQLMPPRRPFAKENSNGDSRPLSYGSDNTFGIITAARSDNGSQISSIGQGSGSNMGSSIIYSNNDNAASQSNHTLGTLLNDHTPNMESYYSSVDEDEIHSKSGSEQAKDATIPSNYIYDSPASKTLSKRINDYLQPQK